MSIEVSGEYVHINGHQIKFQSEKEAKQFVMDMINAGLMG